MRKVRLPVNANTRLCWSVSLVVRCVLVSLVVASGRSAFVGTVRISLIL